MRLATVLLIALLSGCAQLAGSIPSLQYCERVSYLREGAKIELQASCNAPIGINL